jgi:hypothetical protein
MISTGWSNGLRHRDTTKLSLVIGRTRSTGLGQHYIDLPYALLSWRNHLSYRSFCSGESILWYGMDKCNGQPNDVMSVT